MKCPKCESENIAYSHRRGIEKLLRFFYPKTPYRCKDCWTRFWKFGNPTGAILTMLVLLLVIGASVWYYIKFLNSSEEKEPEDTKSSRSLVAKGITQSIPPIQDTTTTVFEEGAITTEVKQLPENAVATDQWEEIDLTTSTTTEVANPAVIKDSGFEPSTEPRVEISTVPQTYRSQIDEGKSHDKEMIPESGDETAPSTAQYQPPLVEKKASLRKLKKVQFQESEETIKIGILSDGPIQEHQFSSMSPPPKLILDIPGKWEYPGETTKWVRSDKIRRIRIGEHSDKLRIVVDLKGRRTVTPLIETTSEGLILIIKK